MPPGLSAVRDPQIMRLDDSCMGDFTRRFAALKIHRVSYGPKIPKTLHKSTGLIQIGE
jgi:hypothetical protein